MKNIVSKLFLLAMICCLSCIPAYAPSAATVNRAYVQYVRRINACGITTRHCIIDLDGDGIREMILFRNITTPSRAAVEFYMYQNGRVARMTMDHQENGYSSIFRVRGSKNFALTKNGSGGSKFMLIYKKTGNRVKLVSKYSREYDRNTGKLVYLKDGKRISFLKFTSNYLRLSAMRLVR